MSTTNDNDASLLTIAPVWTIVLIVVLAVMVIMFSIIFIRRFRKRYHIHTNNVEKKRSIESLATLVTGQQQKNQHVPTTYMTAITPEPEDPGDSLVTTSTSASHPKSCPMQKQDEEDEYAPEPLQEIRISLPLPPPSTSFFSDKTELDSDTSDLYNLYTDSKQTDKNRQSAHYSNSGFISIDLDSFSSAAANIHRKASTMKKNLYQSMRKPASGIKPAPAHQLFAEDSKQEVEEDSSSSRQVAFKLNRDLPKPTTTLSSPVQMTREGPSDDEEPALAAKRIIRSASRKARARSMIINPDQIPQFTPKHEAQKCATLRSPRAHGGEHVTISSGSVRRLVRQSILVPDESFSPKEAALSSTMNRPKNPSNENKIDISRWWDGGKSDAKVAPETIKHSDSSYSVTPQYRASLNNSIFNNTVSKKSAANLFQDQEEIVSVSRSNSAKKGTLGKNALKTLTVNATNGVNRSLRGLFEQSSSLTNINKVVPSDSQKMELNLELEGSVQGSSTSVSRRSSKRTTYLSHSNLEHSSKYSITSDTRKQASDESSQKVEADALIMKQSLSFTGSQDKEVGSVRQALKSSWDDCQPAKEDESRLDFESTGAGSIQTLGANKSSAPRQSLLTKSLLSQAKRTTDLMRSSSPLAEDLQAPEPIASFSSSTIRTVIPDHDQDIMSSHKNRLSINGSSKVLATSFGDEPTMDRFPSAYNDENIHSRRSSGGNSTATAVRISGGYPSSTWNGRAQKNGASRLSVTQAISEENGAVVSSDDKRGFFSTMRKDKRIRGGIPWITPETDMTPAQIERNKYLNAST